MHVVIFTGGQLEKSRLVTDVITAADMIIAADSGANTALSYGAMPHVVVGDMDSIDAKTKHQLRLRQVKFIVSPAEKDETDTELAIEQAITNGATAITLLGGILGDRVDHVVANILYASIATVPIAFVNGMQKSLVVKGPAELCLQGNETDLLSLIPINGDVSGLESTGLQWELHNGTLIFGKPRGVSNVFLQREVSLSFVSGTLFITQTFLSL